MINQHLLIKMDNPSSDYSVSFLRRITRESEKFVVCDTQRYSKFHDNNPTEYLRDYNTAKRFAKDINGNIKQTKNVKNTRYNNDLIFDIRLITNIQSDLICSKDYDELFGAFKFINNASEEKRKYIGKDKPLFTGWDFEITEYLENLFGVDVYHLSDMEYIYDVGSSSSIAKESIVYHITHFGDDKKSISKEQNYHNRTIAFWLFKDKLVIQYLSGINSW